MRCHEDGVYLHASPMFHIADLPAMFAIPALGASQVALPHFTPEDFCRAVETNRVNYTILVPAMINTLTEFAASHKYDLCSLKILGYGGSPMASDLIRRTRALLPQVELVQIYGLTEAGFLTGLRNSEHTEARLMSCGQPRAGVELRVADAEGNWVKMGDHGELVARGANIMRGYWNNPEETAKAFGNGYFRTGDIGYQDSGGYYYILDRLKDMIVTGGENVYSGEVEAVITGHPAVREAAVFGIPDSRWGELVAACVVLKPGGRLTDEELVLYCRQRLANYKIPRHVEFSVDELPKNASGKVLKGHLRERFWAGSQRAVS
jgi:long-chain acyl-CoA synthetase